MMDPNKKKDDNTEYEVFYDKKEIKEVVKEQ